MGGVLRFSGAAMMAVLIVMAASVWAGDIHQRGIVVSVGAGAGVYPESYHDRQDIGYYGHVSVGYCFDGSNLVSVTRHMIFYQDIKSWYMWQPLGIDYTRFWGEKQRITTTLGMYSGERYEENRSYGLLVAAGTRVASYLAVEIKYRGTISPRRYRAADNSLLLELSYRHR